MITINGEQIADIGVIYNTWEKDGTKYTSSKGTVIRIGYYCNIGNCCVIGNGCELDNGCELGNDCELGNCCKLGYYCNIGNDCVIGNDCNIGYYCNIGNCCELDNDCKLGNYCELGNCCKLGNGCESIYPLWFFGIKHPIGFHKKGYVSSGCITKPIQWWIENITRCAEEHNYTPEQVKEYEWRVKTLASWMKMHDLYEPGTKTDN